MKRKKKKVSGGKRMKEFGKKLVGLWLWPEDIEKLKACAKHEGLTMAGFIRSAAMTAVVNLLLESEAAKIPFLLTKTKK